MTPPTREEVQQQLVYSFTTADTDGDGRLSFAEAAGVVAGLGQALFNEMDANADGALDREELGMPVEEEEGGCGCKKSDFTPGGLKKRLGDLFLAGLALVMISAMRGGRNGV